MFNDLLQWVRDLPTLTGILAATALILCVALIADLIARRVLLRIVKHFIKRTSFTWDDSLLEHHVFEHLAHIAPALLVYITVQLIPEISDFLVQFIRNVLLGYIVLMLTLALNSALSAGNSIYETYAVAKDRPIKGFIQIAQIVVFVLGAILILAALLDKSPLLLLSGFGAMTAILLLVFKDTILSLVASVQLNALDMVRVGDWISMPQYDADGDVIDVELHTVRVQNWDKTITTIPTHKLISESFRNWRGMSESGGRRIKRSLHIDKQSARFLTGEETDTFRRFALLRDYITEKENMLREYNAGLGENNDNVNQRRLTNIGTFRAYVRNYIDSRDDIHDGLTQMVRQLDPTPEGLPLEIYCFTATTEWAEYERIQADIFDHLIAILPEFGLRLYQHPSSGDLREGISLLLREPARQVEANEESGESAGAGERGQD